MGKLLLLVGVVENRELLVRTALERGFELAVIDFVDSPALQMAHVPVPVADLFDPIQLGTGLDRLPRRPDGVMTFYDEVIEATAEFARRVGCRFLSPAAAHLGANKVAQRSALTAAGIACPRWETCDDLAAAARAAAVIGYPVMLKVADQAGSIGKVRVHDAAELARTFGPVRDARLDRDVPVLMEELVTGPEYTVEGFVSDGEVTLMCSTYMTTSDGPYPVVLSNALPYTGEVLADIYAATHDVVAALGLTNALFQAGFIVTIRGPVVVELNARAGGDRHMDMIHRLCGCNPYDVALDLALGREPTWSPEWTGRGEAIRWVMPAGTGVFRELDGLPAVLADPDLRSLGLAVRSGGRVTAPPQHCSDRVAWIICEGADWENAHHRAAELVGLIRPVIAA